MGVPQSLPQQNRTSLERDPVRRERSVSLVAKIKERSASFDSRGDYVVGTGHYILQPNVRVEAYDTWRSKLTNHMVFRWRPARIRAVREDSALVAFDGFSERWDLWLPLKEGKIRSPTGGPVVGPDGVLYPPRSTPEPLQTSVTPPIHSPLRPTVPAPAENDTTEPPPLPPPRPIHTISGPGTMNKSSSSLSSSRHPSLPSRVRMLFKKTSRSDEEDEEDEFSSAREDDEEGEMHEADQVTIEMENDEVINRGNDDEEGKTNEFEFPALSRIRRKVSTSSSMVVETGDIPTPPRTTTPPSLGLYHLPFLRRSFGEKLDAAAKQKQTTGESSTTDESIVTSPLPSRANSATLASSRSNNNKENKSIPVSTISTRGVSGLVNLGNTCFMNAVLQSLAHVPPLVERLLLDVQTPTQEEAIAPVPPQDPPRRLIRSDRLAKVFSILVREQWKANPDRARRPEELKKLIGEIAPQFQGQRQQDAQELLVCLLDGLHDCLNRIKRRPTYVEMNPPKHWSDEELAFYYWDNYERGNDSFIKDLFCGQLMSRVKCGDCEAISTSFDVFWDLSLPVPQQDRPAAVSDLLRSFCDVEKMTGDSGFKCDSCKQTPSSGVTKQFSIAMRPKVLVLHLKRFSHEKTGTKKITTPVTFPTKGLKAGEDVYDLAAVVNHVGSFASGHYTADVYNPMTKAWYHADDQNMTPTTRIGVNAYLLFYVESTRSERAVKTLVSI